MESTAVSAASLNVFVELSSVLTGYARRVQAPPFDSIDLKTSYYNTAQQEQGEVFPQLLTVFAQIMKTTPPPQWPQAVADKILGSAALGPAARQIIKLWFTGAWYCNDKQGSSRVVSMNAYTGGLIWDAIQAHPQGDSVFQFGYWASAPPPPGPTSGSGDQGGAQ